MKGPPLKVSPSEPLAKVDERPVRRVDGRRDGFDDLYAVEARTSRWAPSIRNGPGKLGFRGSALGEASLDPRSARPEVTVRV